MLFGLTFSSKNLTVSSVGVPGVKIWATPASKRPGDAGYEVIYTGLRQTPEAIVATAVQEDVDAIGLSILSGAHNTVFPRNIIQTKAAQHAPILLNLV